jgi:hypothetical protein
VNLKLDRQKLRDTRQTPWLALDLAMVFLVVLNLLFIVFDTLYGTQAFRSLLAGLSPEFADWYGERIHPDFLLYDLGFITIFLAVFVFEWVVAVRRQTYARWYFFPFLRWYDLVSCIPIGSLRLLRLLRIASLLIRLHRMGIVDLTNSRVYRFFEFYFNVFIDEVSDRVILRTLDDVRREIEDESPIGRQVAKEIIAPRREQLVEHLSRRIGAIAQQSYDRHEDAMRTYVESVIAEAVDSDPGVHRLQRVPVVGRPVVETLRQSIKDIVYRVFDRVARDISDAERNRLVDESVTVVIDALLEEHPELGDLGKTMTVEAIEVIKDRVRVQHWKESLARREADAARMPT